jgi:hypothetical protein
VADVIDLATGKPVGRAPPAEAPEMLDLSPHGKTIYVSQEEDAGLGMLMWPTASA